MTIRPSGGYASRRRDWIWLVDCSASMTIENRIQTLNYAIREAIPAMREVAAENPEAQVMVRSLKFSNGARWITREGTPLKQFSWIDVDVHSEDATVGEQTHLGAAFRPLAEELRALPTTGRNLP